MYGHKRLVLGIHGDMVVANIGLALAGYLRSSSLAKRSPARTKGGGTLSRESSSSPEGGRLRRQDKAQRQSLMSMVSWRPSSRCSANTKRLSLARSSTRYENHRRDVWFARRRTVAHRSHRQPGTVDASFTRISRDQVCRAGEDTWNSGKVQTWLKDRESACSKAWGASSEDCCPLEGSTTGSAFSGQCSASQKARDGWTQKDGRRKRGATTETVGKSE